MQCVILAGGLGTRIRSVIPDLPKALIPVAGKPFAFYQWDWLASQGVTKVVYCIGYQGDAIRKAALEARVDLNFAFSDEGQLLRGTGGAIRFALDQGLLDGAFLVLYADSYLPVEIAPLWMTSVGGGKPTMAVLRNEGRWDASNVVFQDGLVERYEKGLTDPAAEGMSFIDYGLSVLNRETILERTASGEVVDLADIYRSLASERKLLGHEVHQRFYEIGSPAGLAEIEQLLATGRH